MAGLSAVLPAFNEQEVIGQTVLAVDQALAKLVEDYEIIVVNDGSVDATAQRLAALQQRCPSLRVQTHARNLGYGAALATGFNAASKELIFLTDGDKQFDVAQLAEFWPLPPDVDLYIGYRSPRADPPLRRLFGWCWSLLVSGLFGDTARDVDCAFKLFRREIWQRLEIKSRGATFSAELLVKALRVGYRVRERPVRHYPRPAGSPTGARPAVIARAFKELFRLRRDLAVELASSEAAYQARQQPGTVR